MSALPTSSQIVLVLCGLVGSGKSTFATALHNHFPQFVRCSQDELGSRQLVEELVVDSLERGDSVCIDRTNVDQRQRKTWIDIARRFPNTLVWALIFNTPKEVCRQRIVTRTGHPTIHSPSRGLQILESFARDFRFPTYAEGFDRIYSQTVHPRIDYTQAEVADILDRIDKSWSPPHPQYRPPPAEGHPVIYDFRSAPQGQVPPRGHANRRYGQQIPARNAGRRPDDRPRHSPVHGPPARRARGNNQRRGRGSPHRGSRAPDSSRGSRQLEGGDDSRYEPYRHLEPPSA